MSGISIGHSHSRPCSGEKTLRRCRKNKEADNIILIDVDSENFDNVIIIDVPESLPKKMHGSSMLRKDKKNVIYIDDDETPDASHSIGVNKGSFSAGATSSREYFRVAKNFADAGVEESQYVPENVTPVRLSKCKRTYSGNRFGLNTNPESDSSDDDYPECELVVDSSGKVQKLWEKAFSRKRKGVQNGHSGIRDHDNVSRVVNEDHHTHPHYNKSDARGSSDSQATGSPFIYAEQEDDLDCEPGSSSSHIDERGKHPAAYKSACQEQSTKEFDHSTSAFKDEKTPEVEPCPPKSESCINKDSCNGKSCQVEDDAKCQNPFETGVNLGRSFPKDNYKNFQEIATGSVKESERLEPGQPHATGSAEEMQNLMPERSSFKRSTLPYKQSNCSSNPSCNTVGSVSGKSIFSENILASGDDNKKRYGQENRQPVLEIPICGNIHPYEAKLPEDDSVSISRQEENKDDQMLGQNGDDLPSVESCIINEREKLKETEEYKRAIEEEWASRKQALRIQAEEAQRLRRLRKRRKAESMRLLDMERRQKQRVEEMRNTQKKDEENMNLKELIQAEVRKELKKLEMTCHNMATLLHSMGIHVGGWPNSLPKEVQTAYKRALLTFHPDRASRYDIRQQVEAEEKFKLINRLKEKFSPSL